MIKRINEEAYAQDTYANGTFSEELNTGVLPILDADLSSVALDDIDIKSVEDIFPLAINAAKPIIEDTLKSIIPVKVSKFSFYHTKYYYYTGDEVEFVLSGKYSDYEKLEQECLADAEQFDSFLKNNYSSYSGYVSFLPSDIDEFKEEKTFWKKLCQVIMYHIPEHKIDRNTSDYKGILREDCIDYFGWAEDDYDFESVKRKKSIKESKKSLKESFWYGIPDIKFIWHGEWSDPEISYMGYCYNPFSIGIEEAEWEYLEDELGRQPTDEEFEEHMKMIGDEIKFDLQAYVPECLAQEVEWDIELSPSKDNLLDTLQSLKGKTYIPDKKLNQIIAKVESIPEDEYDETAVPAEVVDELNDINSYAEMFNY